MMQQFIKDLEVPTLDLRGRMGFTDYIDFLRPKDMEYPIMKGVDRYQRTFLALRVKSENSQNVHRVAHACRVLPFPSDLHRIIYQYIRCWEQRVACFHQRYTDYEEGFVLGGWGADFLECGVGTEGIIFAHDPRFQAICKLATDPKTASIVWKKRKRSELIIRIDIKN